MSLKQLSIVQYATPDLIPAALRPVAVILDNAHAYKANLAPNKVTVYQPGQTLPAGVKPYGGVLYSSGDTVPDGLRQIAGLSPSGDPQLNDGFSGSAIDTSTWTVTDTYPTTQILTNGGFETAGGGGADVFGTWAETAGTGTISDEITVIHGGSHACKIAQAAPATSNSPKIEQSITVIPGLSYKWTFWAAGDGTNAGRYGIWDITNAANILGSTSTGVISTTYSQVTVTFTAPAGCVSVSLIFRPAVVDNAFAYFDDASVLPAQGLLSVSGGAVVWSGGKVSPLHGDPGITTPSSLAITRRAGVTLQATLQSSNVTKGGPYLVWSTTTPLSGQAHREHAVLLDNTGVISYARTTTALVLPLATVNGTAYPCRLILETTGVYLQVYQSGVWRTVWIGSTGTTTPLYPTLYSYNAPGQSPAAYVYKGVVPTLLANVASVATITPTLGSLQSSGTLTVGLWYRIGVTQANYFYTGCAAGDKFLATAATALDANNTVRQLTLSTCLGTEGGDLRITNFLADVAPTITSVSQYGMMLRGDTGGGGPQNFILGYIDRYNDTARLVKCVAGTYTTLINTAITYVAGQVLRVVANGNLVALYYNNAQIGATQTISDAGIVSNTLYYPFCTDTVNSGANWKVYA